MSRFLVLFIILLNVGCAKKSISDPDTTEQTCESLAGDQFTNIGLKDEKLVCLDQDCFGITCSYGPEEIEINNQRYLVSLEMSTVGVEFYKAQEVSGSTDGGSTDGGSTDGGSTDGGSTDGGSTDGGSTDGGSTDGGSTDGGSTDGGSTDGGSPDGQDLGFAGAVLDEIDFKNDLNAGADLRIDLSQERTFIKVYALSNPILERSSEYTYELELVSGSGSIRFDDNAISMSKDGFLGFNIKSEILKDLKSAFITYKLVAIKGSEVVSSEVSKIRNIAIDE